MIKVGDWVDIKKKIILYDFKKQQEYETIQPFERGEVIEIKNDNIPLVYLHTIIHRPFDTEEIQSYWWNNRSCHKSFGYRLDECFIVDNYKNKTVEQLSDEFYKIYDEWYNEHITKWYNEIVQPKHEKIKSKHERTRECVITFQKALERRKKQCSLDHEFKYYIKTHYPEIYKEVVEYLNKI